MAKIDDLHDLKLLHEHKLAVMTGEPTPLDTHYKALAALSVWQRHAESDDYVNALADVNATETRLERAKRLHEQGWRVVFVVRNERMLDATPDDYLREVLNCSEVARLSCKPRDGLAGTYWCVLTRQRHIDAVLPPDGAIANAAHRVLMIGIG